MSKFVACTAKSFIIIEDGDDKYCYFLKPLFYADSMLCYSSVAS